MVGDKKVLSLITFSKNIHENKNYNGNVTLVKWDGKEINAYRKLSLKIRSFENCQKRLGVKKYCIVKHCPRPYGGLNVNGNVTSANRGQEESSKF